MGHVFDSQVLGSHKCPNCGAVLTDHESSVFENALVRSMIRDWLANETELAVVDNFTVQEEDLFKSGDCDKVAWVFFSYNNNCLQAFVNNRRVLKPRQALANLARPKQEISNMDTTQAQSETKPEMANSESSPSVHNELSQSPLISQSELPETSDHVTVSSPSALPFVSVSDLTDTVNSPLVVTQNTSTTVVASAPCTTPVGANRQALLAVTCGLSSSQIPCLSHTSSSIIPSALTSINGGGNPLLNALCSMRVDNLSAPLVAPSAVLPTPFQGPLVGGPDWTAGSVLAASVAPGTGLVDPALQVNSNQVAAFGLVSGQAIQNPIHAALSAPIEPLDGHKVLSKEEFYRLKMEMLHSTRRR